MVYLFLEESGDLGFKATSSKWFIFAIAVCQDRKTLERVVKKFWRHLRKKHKRLGELHASHEKPVIKRQLLRILAELDDLKILCVALNKQKVYSNFKEHKNYLYNYAANILMEKLHNSNLVPIGDTIELFADRRDTNKNLNDNFTRFLTQGVKVRGVKGFNVELKSSYESRAIQAVDFISWAIFSKYEKGV
jgi:hypothetical protein